MLFKIDQNRAIDMPFAQREIVDAKHARGGTLRESGPAVNAQDGMSTAGQPQPFGCPCPRPTTKCQAQHFERLGQTGRALGANRYKIGQPLGKRALWTNRRITEEATDVETEADPLVTDGQVTR
jgi:hypothetical protein